MTKRVLLFSLFSFAMLFNTFISKVMANDVQKNAVPYLIEVNDNVALISININAKLFYLDLNKQENILFLDMLNQSLKNHIPVNIYSYENSNEISSVRDLSKTELTAFTEAKQTNKSFSILSDNSLSSNIPLETANNLFDSIKKNSDIPFDYISSGCESRAHKIAQILYLKGYDSKKRYISGILAAFSSRTSCCPRWGNHVASQIEVMMPNSSIEKRIIDPSLFDHLVTIAEWRSACLNTECVDMPRIYNEEEWSRNVYKYDQNTGRQVYDDDYSKTDEELTNNKRLGANKCSLEIEGPDEIQDLEQITYKVNRIGMQTGNSSADWKSKDGKVVLSNKSLSSNATSEYSAGNDEIIVKYNGLTATKRVNLVPTNLRLDGTGQHLFCTNEEFKIKIGTGDIYVKDGINVRWTTGGKSDRIYQEGSYAKFLSKGHGIEVIKAEITFKGNYLKTLTYDDIWLSVPSTPTSIGGFEKDQVLYPNTNYTFIAHGVAYADIFAWSYSSIPYTSVSGASTSILNLKTGSTPSDIPVQLSVDAYNRCSGYSYLTVNGFMRASNNLLKSYAPADDVMETRAATTGIQNSINDKNTIISSVRVYAVTGALVYSSNTAESKLNIQSLGLNDGIYIVETMDESGNLKREKLMIRK